MNDIEHAGREVLGAAIKVEAEALEKEYEAKVEVHRAQIKTIEQQIVDLRTEYRIRWEEIRSRCPHKDSGSMFFAICAYCGESENDYVPG